MFEDLKTVASIFNHISSSCVTKNLNSIADHIKKPHNDIKPTLLILSDLVPHVFLIQLSPSQPGCGLVWWGCDMIMIRPEGKEKEVQKKWNKWLAHRIQTRCFCVLNLLSASITSFAVPLLSALQFQGFASFFCFRAVWGLNIEKLFQLLNYINQISKDLAHSRAGLLSFLCPIYSEW